MSRKHCTERLLKIVSILDDIEIDVSLLFPLVDEFLINITDTLKSQKNEGILAERLLLKLK